MSRPSSGPTAEIVVQNASGSTRVPPDDQIERWVRQALGASRGGELTVRIVDESESAALNEQFRSERGSTNVLAFPAGDMPFGEEPQSAPLGDIVICAPVLEREAAEQGKSLDAHWAHISIHGTLHLLGYDHERVDEARQMEDRERELLGSMGFSDPYGVDS